MRAVKGSLSYIHAHFMFACKRARCNKVLDTLSSCRGLSSSRARDKVLLYEDGNVFFQLMQSLQGMLGSSAAL